MANLKVKVGEVTIAVKQIQQDRGDPVEKPELHTENTVRYQEDYLSCDSSNNHARYGKVDCPSYDE